MSKNFKVLNFSFRNPQPVMQIADVIKHLFNKNLLRVKGLGFRGLEVRDSKFNGLGVRGFMG